MLWTRQATDGQRPPVAARESGAGQALSGPCDVSPRLLHHEVSRRSRLRPRAAPAGNRNVGPIRCGQCDLGPLIAESTVTRGSDGVAEQSTRLVGIGKFQRDSEARHSAHQVHRLPVGQHLLPLRRSAEILLDERQHGVAGADEQEPNQRERENSRAGREALPARRTVWCGAPRDRPARSRVERALRPIESGFRATVRAPLAPLAPQDPPVSFGAVPLSSFHLLEEQWTE